MNETQIKIILQIRELLLEHFDAHVLIVESDEINDDRDHCQSGSYSGPRSRLVGMCELTKEEITILHRIALAENKAQREEQDEE